MDKNFNTMTLYSKFILFFNRAFYFLFIFILANHLWPCLAWPTWLPGQRTGTMQESALASRRNECTRTVLASGGGMLEEDGAIPILSSDNKELCLCLCCCFHYPNPTVEPFVASLGVPAFSSSWCTNWTQIMSSPYFFHEVECISLESVMEVSHWNLIPKTRPQSMGSVPWSRGRSQSNNYSGTGSRVFFWYIFLNFIVYYTIAFSISHIPYPPASQLWKIFFWLFI